MTNKFNYKVALMTPLWLLVGQVGLSFFLKLVNLPLQGFFSAILSLCGWAIMLYAGYLVTNRYAGNVTEAVLLGLLLTAVEVGLTLVTVVLNFFTNAGYRTSLSVLGGLGSVTVYLALIAIVVGIPISAAINVALSALGGVIGQRGKSNQATTLPPTPPSAVV